MLKLILLLFAADLVEQMQFLTVAQRREGAECVHRLPVLFCKSGTFRRIISIPRLDCCEKKNALFVVSRSDMYIVSIQQTGIARYRAILNRASHPEAYVQF